MRRAYTDYVVLILQNNGLYYQWKISEKGTEKLPSIGNDKTFTYRGNKYVFDPDYAHHLKGWVPWHEFDVFTPWSVLEEFYWRIKHKVGLIIYREPKPVKVVPVPPNQTTLIPPPSPAPVVPSAPIMPVSMHLELGYTRYSPLSFKAIVLSPLYAAYRKKQFAGRFRSNFVIWLLIAGVVVLGAIVLMMVM
jgi:hypothetical protein